MRGFSLVEMLAAMALLAVLLLFMASDLRGAERRLDFEFFAREVIRLLEVCRWKAINQRCYAGIWLHNLENTYYASLYQDGNANGIRLGDIRDGKDSCFQGPVRLERSSADIVVGILQTEVPQIPPRTGLLDSDPIKFGRSDIISFSPNGDSSSGTLYLACHSQKQMYAIVVFGPTARWTLWKYSNQQWQMVEDR